MQTLTDKIALVTGASAGIGRAAARLFARHGARVVVTARRAELLDALVDQIRADGGDAHAVPGDLADPDFPATLAAQTHRHYGGLDIAFDNAGTLGPIGPTPDVPLDAWRHTLTINLTAAFLLAQSQIPLLRARGGGSIIFTSTFVGHSVGLPGLAAYAASKAGLIGLTRALAAELGPDAIRVNALVPGGTDTDMGRAVASTPEALAAVCRLHALGRIAHPDEIAHSALYLASDAARFTTGTALFADGGASIYRGV